MSRVRALVMSVILVFSVCAVAPAAALTQDHVLGSDGGLSAAAEWRMRAFMEEYGVSPEVQDAILDKVGQGVLPDSDSGADPVSELTYEEGGEWVTVRTFGDGSIAVSSVSLPNDGGAESTSFRGVKGCVRSGGSLVNCLAEYSTVLGYSSFYFDRTAPSGAVGTIRNLRGYRVSTYTPLTSVSNQRLEIISSWQGRLSWDLSAIGHGVTSAMYLQVNLGRNGTAYVTAA